MLHVDVQSYLSVINVCKPESAHASNSKTQFVELIQKNHS